MRVKKAKEPPRLIRYLLSADRKLQRISLRKMTAPRTRARKAPRSTRSKSSSRANHTRIAWAVDPRAVAVAAIGVVGTVALIAAYQPTRATVVPAAGASEAVQTMTGAQAPSESNIARETQHAAAAPRRESEKATVSKAPARPPSDAPTVQASMIKAPVRESVKTVRTADPVIQENASVAELNPKAAVETVAPVTITGCVERDDESFWLKDTSGAGAPMSRSWRSGFLKRRPSRIELVDATSALELPRYIGQRVAATGLLVNREMHTRSVYLVSSSCN